ncbi:MAG TPA: TonB family protein [Hyphomonadaceae bacterium]|nr:TonB family protein [Hyphomonadaceae bacterium]HPN05906.1 TonB family protein [Hyphomonadaceae bacterium]
MRKVEALSVMVLLNLCLSAEADPPGVTLEDGTWRYSDQSPLFFHVNDTVPGQSNCAGTCATIWTVITADVGDAPSGYWSIEKQTDGRHIWAYRGKPVYRMINPNRTGYKGSSALWVRAEMTRWFPPGVAIVDNGYGTDLIGMIDGRKLRTPSFNTCNDACRAKWMPLEPSSDAVTVQDWFVSQDEGGQRIWAYRTPNSHVYIERSQMSDGAAQENAAQASRMSAFGPIRFRPTEAPIAIADGAYDVHDASIVKTPRLAPGVEPPAYPIDALRDGDQGAVTIQLCLDESGAVTDSKMVGSSGFTRLDRATEVWVPTVRFLPGFTTDGAVRTCGYTFTFDWSLRDINR